MEQKLNKKKAETEHYKLDLANGIKGHLMVALSRKQYFLGYLLEMAFIEAEQEEIN